MKTNIYKEAIHNLPIGYMHYKVIYDSAGTAIDYIFIDANDLFEEYTGLKKKDIIDQKASVYSNIKV